MDTGSHLIFGVTLAGLSLFHPEVASSSQLTTAILSVTLVGSHAPDLDSVFRLKSQDAYLKQHRGLSHSIPALLIGSVLIGGLAAWLWNFEEHFLLLSSFAFLALAVHVLFDWTNAYGVQFLLPFKKAWLHLDTLCLTDPFLFILHAVVGIGCLLGLWSYEQWACVGAWVITIVYVIWRVVHHEIVVYRVRKRHRRWRALHVLPGLWWFRWYYVVQTDQGFEMGVIEGRRLLPSRYIPFSAPHACIEATLQVTAVRTLLLFAKRKHVSWTQEPDGGYLVTWTDLRFWQEKDWPYRAEVRLDSQFNVLTQQIGWYKKAWEAPHV